MVLSPERWPYLSGRVALFSRTDGILRPEFTIETVRFHRDRMEREAAAPEDVPDSVIARILHAHRVLSGIEQLEQHFKIELHAAADDDLFGRADDAPGQI